MVTLRHEEAENKKFSGPQRDAKHRPIAGQAIIQDLIDNHNSLNAFTIDEFGQFGPQAYRILSEKHSPYAPHNAAERSQKGLNDVGRSMSEFTYHPDYPTSLLDQADKAWREKHDKKWFTSTYHAQTPSQWANQCLGWGLVMPMVQYFDHAIKKVTRNTHPKPNLSKIRKVPGTSPFTTMTPATMYVKPPKFIIPIDGPEDVTCTDIAEFTE
jgi:hypothetical protein